MGRSSDCYYPEADFYKLFVWDDEVDAEVGRLAGDLEAAANFRNDTLQFIK